ncbi:molybdopterin-dependent oxidoreductase [Adhaeribacter swui]|uniref:Molybdopterin-dependent oxidoreductase n=1 Tax=Adhaeribacter swui TaxID=2086471 RepID=A0A7G7GBC4_9BACT|nr:molybdopterin-dependent oxidoreductase [Adhaeribacter swui]QNF34458.1 molybdopterin-dependent oxidoreductase [Adhaeribacter swui]
MITKIYFSGIYLLAFLLLGYKGHAQAPEKNILQVSGEVKEPLTITLAAIDTMEKSSVIVLDKTNQAHTYSGVLLATILKKAGVTLGAELKGKNLKKYVLLKAPDGYQVVFSLAEIDPAFSNKKIILATRINGELLGTGQGPFQIIVEGEKKKTRFIRQVNHIIIQSAS